MSAWTIYDVTTGEVRVCRRGAGLPEVAPEGCGVLAGWFPRGQYRIEQGKAVKRERPYTVVDAKRNESIRLRALVPLLLEAFGAHLAEIKRIVPGYREPIEVLRLRDETQQIRETAMTVVASSETGDN